MTSTTSTSTGTNRPAAARPRWLLPVAVAAAGFGVMTLVASSRVLFGSEAARAAEGAYVPFVLWFNFLAGFAYVALGAALAAGRPWAARLALGIAASTAFVFAAFGVHALGGGNFEVHTVKAMTVRTIVGAGLAVVAYRHFRCSHAVS